MDRTYVYAGLILFTIINFFLRASPFLILGNRELPDWLDYLSRHLPGAIMAILVIYNLRNTVFTQAPYGIPELIAVVVTVILHYWKESTVLTLVGGTAVYVALLTIM